MSSGSAFDAHVEKTAKQPKIVIAGGSGFLGRTLSKLLLRHNYRVIVLSRSSPPKDAVDGVAWLQWDGRTHSSWCSELEDAVALVNLVGKSVDCRKTPKEREEILSSRVDSVRVLGEAISLCSNPPPVWVQSGSAHILGDPVPFDTICDDNSPIGEGFAPEVCMQWEKAFHDAIMPQQRGVLFRMSFVLGHDGGAMQRLVKLTRWGLGGRISSGKQYISWIHEDDMSRLFLDAIRDDQYRGTYLATSPRPVTNAVFMSTLRSVWRRPWSPPVPAFMVRLGARLIMNTDPELALLGRRCIPSRLVEETNFWFKWPQLQPALNHLREATLTARH